MSAIVRARSMLEATAVIGKFPHDLFSERTETWCCRECHCPQPRHNAGCNLARPNRYQDADAAKAWAEEKRMRKAMARLRTR